jgi:hypothetical protein
MVQVHMQDIQGLLNGWVMQLLQGSELLLPAAQQSRQA